MGDLIMRNEILDYTIIVFGNSLENKQKSIILDLILLAEDYERLKKSIQ